MELFDRIKSKKFDKNHFEKKPPSPVRTDSSEDESHKKSDELLLPRMKKCEVRLPRRKTEKLFKSVAKISNVSNRGRGRPSKIVKSTTNGGFNKKVVKSPQSKKSEKKIFLKLDSISPTATRKRKLGIALLDEKELAKMYGKKFFRCRVKIARSNMNLVIPREKINRKCVSFDETVEVIGDVTDSESSDNDPDYINGASKTNAKGSSASDKIKGNTAWGETKGSRKSFSPLRNSDIITPRKGLLKRGDERMPVKSLLLEDEDDEDVEWIVPTDIPNRRSLPTSPCRDSDGDSEKILPDELATEPKFTDTDKQNNEDNMDTVEKLTSTSEQETTSNTENENQQTEIKLESIKNVNIKESILADEGNSEVILELSTQAHIDDMVDPVDKIINETLSMEFDENFSQSFSIDKSEKGQSTNTTTFFCNPEQPYEDIVESECINKSVPVVDQTEEETVNDLPVPGKLNSFFQNIKAKILSPRTSTDN